MLKITSLIFFVVAIGVTIHLGVTMDNCQRPADNLTALWWAAMVGASAVLVVDEFARRRDG